MLQKIHLSSNLGQAFSSSNFPDLIRKLRDGLTMPVRAGSSPQGKDSWEGGHFLPGTALSCIAKSPT